MQWLANTYPSPTRRFNPALRAIWVLPRNLELLYGHLREIGDPIKCIPISDKNEIVCSPFASGLVVNNGGFQCLSDALFPGLTRHSIDLFVLGSK